MSSARGRRTESWGDVSVQEAWKDLGKPVLGQIGTSACSAVWAIRSTSHLCDSICTCCPLFPKQWFFWFRWNYAFYVHLCANAWLLVREIQQWARGPGLRWPPGGEWQAQLLLLFRGQVYRCFPRLSKRPCMASVFPSFPVCIWASVSA